MGDQHDRPERTAQEADERASHHLHPEPLELDAEDLLDALPHGDNPHPPSEAQVQAP